MKQRKKRYLPLFLALLLCVGCGKASGSTEPGMTGGSTEGQNVEQGSEGPERTFRLDKTVSLAIEDPDTGFSNKFIYSGAYGSTLYLLASYQFEDGAEPAMWMYIFDLTTQETVKIPFSLETPGMEKPHIDSMTVTDKDVLTFQLYGSLEGGDSSVYLYKTDLTGKPLDKETPFSDDTAYLPDTGRFFAIADDFPILLETEGFMTSNLFRYYEQSQKSVPLASVNGIVTALCADGQGGLYYVSSDQLRHLNLKDMTDETLCRTAEYGIKLTHDNWLLCDGDGRLALCSVNTDNPRVYLLTDQEETIKREPIRMACMAGTNYIPQFADEWSAKSDKYRIIKEEVDESKLRSNLVSEYLQALEPIRTRVMAELVSGKGPELMYVTEDDMHMLAEKGALMDLSELIPEDIQEQLLPGIRQLGTVDGEWVGITYNVYYYVLMTSNSLWGEDGWTVSDFLDLMESRDDWDWIMSEPWFDEGTDYNALFERLFAVSMGDSPFMDVENGISYFNGEEFIRTLELCKRYGQSGDVTVGHDEALRSMVQEGKSIARRVYLFGRLNDFSEAVTIYEDCHMVGFPSEKGSGNYMYSQGYLVVNTKAEHVDAIKDYLSYILDYNVQFSGGNVRKDVPRDQITVHPDYNMPAILRDPSDLTSGYSYALIDYLKPDGTTYIEEYMEFVESCEPIPYCPDAVKEIVKEEIGAYFTGDRSARDTADIIHRRVQLYFDERN